MRKLALAAVAVLAAASFQADAAAKKETRHTAVVHGACFSAADMEADQAIRYQTDLMVISSACQNTTYAEFRLRNKDEIIAYQKAMIAHFRHEGSRAPDKTFETFITNLANEASLKQNGSPTALICQKATDMLKKASLLDPRAFHAYAAQQAQLMSASYTKCSR